VVYSSVFVLVSLVFPITAYWFSSRRQIIESPLIKLRPVLDLEAEAFLHE
jgi:hypothetical protein